MKHILRTLAVCGLAVALGAATVQAQTATTIYAINQGSHPVGTWVSITGAVVVGVDSKPSSFGLYIQAGGGGAYSGILVFLNTRTLTNAYDNAIGTTPQLGDVVDVSGGYTEFGGLSEITAQTTPVVAPLVINKMGTTAVPAPVPLPVDSLKVGYAGAERWEGVLVRVDSVVVTSLNNFNDWRFHQFNGPAPGRVDSLVGYEKMISGQVIPEVGDKLNVIGVGDFAFSERRIAPRNDNDITFLTPGPAAVPNLCYSPAENKIKVRFNVGLNVADAQNVTKYSLSTFETISSAVYTAATKTVLLTTGTPLVPSVTPHVLTMTGIRNSQGTPMVGSQNISFIGGVSTITFIQTPKSATNDSSQVANQQVTFRGVVTETTSGAANADFPSATGGFYVQQRGATQYGAIFVFGPPSTPVKNDSVLVSGVISEFGVGPETELVSVDEVTVLGANRPPIQPIGVTVAQLAGPNNDAEAEKFEGCLVKLTNCVALNDDDPVNVGIQPGQPFDVSTALAGVDTVRVDDLAVREFGYAAIRGNVIDVTGIIRFSGTLPFRRLQPRNWSEPANGGDIRSTTGITDAAPGAFRTALLQNQPNPFNPTTRIEFTMERAGKAAVRVYDVTGKRVRTVFNGDAKAGPNSLVWDGRDERGRSVGSGVYLYSLFAGDVVQTRKMMLLK